MKSLREYITEAENKGVAIGHFNISNLEALHGIYNGAKKLSNKTGELLPVIIGVSEGEENFVGLDMVYDMVHSIRDEHNYPIFLNADHHTSFESVKKCIDAGFDMVIIDAAKLPHDENIKITKQCVDYAHEVNKNTGRDVLVEAELGFIGSGSDIKETIPEGAGILTKPEDAKNFVEQTGIGLFAPSVGSIHGLIKSGKPHIDVALVKEIAQITHVPLVLHGGSGLRDEDFTNAIKAGICIVHINSELRLAYRDAVEKTIEEHPNEIIPAKLLTPAVLAIENIVFERLKLFNHIL
jgi:fructose-bisphosphate aldolase class II